MPRNQFSIWKGGIDTNRLKALGRVSNQVA
jgi:hypothetical protein